MSAIVRDLGRALSDQISQAVKDKCDLVHEPKEAFQVCMTALATLTAMTGAYFAHAYGMQDASDEDVCKAVLELIFEADKSRGTPPVIQA